MPADIRGFSISATVFLLLYAKSIISHRFSCIATAGLASLLLLLFTGPGLVTLTRFLLLPALIIDLLMMLSARAISTAPACAMTALLAFSWSVVWLLFRQIIAGNGPLVALQNSFSAFGTEAIFAILGGLPVVYIAGKTRFLFTSKSKTKKR